MRGFKVALLLPALMLGSIAQAQTYDSSSKTLSLPSVVVDGAQFSNVVIILDSIRVLAAEAPATANSANRNCTGTLGDFTFSATIKPAEDEISVNFTSHSNTALFAPHYISLVQGSNSLQGYLRTGDGYILWTGASSGSVPSGVTKTGKFSGFPSWFNLSTSFNVVTVFGAQMTCQ
jgi:hypothetical protein